MRHKPMKKYITDTRQCHMVCLCHQSVSVV